MGCCVVSMSCGKRNPDYPLGGTVVCDVVADSSWEDKLITAPLINAASPQEPEFTESYISSRLILHTGTVPRSRSRSSLTALEWIYLSRQPVSNCRIDASNSYHRN